MLFQQALPPYAVLSLTVAPPLAGKASRGQVVTIAQAYLRGNWKREFFEAPSVSTWGNGISVWLGELGKVKDILKIDELICATLRGENRPWPTSGDDEFAASFLLRSKYHGVQALLDQRLQTTRGAELGWPKAVVERCRRAAILRAMWEMRHRELLNQVLAGLSNSGVRPILFKGTALSYDLYSSPFLRTRGDTDFIIPLDARDQVCGVLESLGFACQGGVKGEFVNSTAVYSRIDSATGFHELDVHWRISNSHFLSKLLTYEELRSEARPLPTLGRDALAVGAVHALLIACMHRAVHKQCPYFVGGIEYYGGDRLIWLFDIHLLLGELRHSQFDAFLELAERKGLGGVCLEGIEHARACFHSFVPEAVCEALSRLRRTGAASRYLSGSVTYQYYLNFLSVGGAGNKMSFLTQLVFPPEEYMRDLYSQVKPNWLPWLYLRRAMIEIFKRFYRTLAPR